jgi:hypothetical protein
MGVLACQFLSTDKIIDEGGVFSQPPIPMGMGLGIDSLMMRGGPSILILPDENGPKMKIKDGRIIADEENAAFTVIPDFDYMVGIADNARQWAHPLRKDFNPSERVDLTETVLFSSSNRVSSG